MKLAAASGREPLDLSLGVPAEPAPEISRARGSDGRTAPSSYPPSAGRPELRAAIVEYLARRFRVEVPASAVAACAGGKEFISTVPSLLRLAQPDRAVGRDTALIPALGYPPYEFGARLAGLKVERVPADTEHQMVLDRIPDRLAARALYLWVNSPANPTGAIEHRMAKIVSWGRERGITILSDEAYAELIWNGVPQTALATGLDNVLAVHSVSKRSNAPGLRVGFYAGDPLLVSELLRLRRATGLIAAEESQLAAVRLLGDDAHAADLHARTAGRVAGLVESCNAHGLRCHHPEGSMLLWVAAPGGNGVDFAYEAAIHAGLVVAPGIDYGPSGGPYVRIAAVQDPIVVEQRLSVLVAAGCLGDPIAKE